MTLHIDYHIIQTVPPSNLNRDDTGSPKTATYGGVRRARVSSQAWKRATRQSFKGQLDASELGVRTLRAVELLVGRMQELSPGLDTATAQTLAAQTLKALGLSVKAKRKAQDGDSPMTEYLIFFSNQQLDRLAALTLESGEKGPDAKSAKAAFDAAHSVDVALFGRMVANDAQLNVDAACQVAHAISTHAVTNEFDYYTAVDDKAPEEETGAGMIGTIEFNSSTLYRYATVNVDCLHDHLGDGTATVRAIEAFTRSFVTSMPTGKRNTFANGTLPDAVVVMVRQGRPVNLVGAFEDPVKGDGGFVTASCEALATHAAEVADAFGGAPAKAWVSRVGARTASLDTLGQHVDFETLVREVGAAAEASLMGQG